MNHVSNSAMQKLIEQATGFDRQVLETALSEIEQSRQKILELTDYRAANTTALAMLKPVFLALQKQSLIDRQYEYRLVFGTLETGVHIRGDDLLNIAETMSWGDSSQIDEHPGGKAL